MKKKSPKLSKVEQQVLADLQSGSGLQSALAPMIKRVMEAALEGEMDHHLAEKKKPKEP